jgi:hypothetical protein
LPGAVGSSGGTRGFIPGASGKLMPASALFGRHARLRAWSTELLGRPVMLTPRPIPR